jgi:hypothetical protein
LASSYLDQLLTISRRIADGEIPAHEHNECFTAGAFDLLVVHARGAEAFQLLTDLCARFPAERDVGGNLSGYYNLLAQVARQTGTTEMPQGMTQVMSACPELSSELREWYRAA